MLTSCHRKKHILSVSFNYFVSWHIHVLSSLHKDIDFCFCSKKRYVVSLYLRNRKLILFFIHIEKYVSLLHREKFCVSFMFRGKQIPSLLHKHICCFSLLCSVGNAFNFFCTHRYVASLLYFIGNQFYLCSAKKYFILFYKINIFRCI